MNTRVSKKAAAAPAPKASVADDGLFTYRCGAPIGQYWPGQGGINVGLVRGENGNGDYFLIVAIEKAPDTLAWGGYGESEDGAQSSYDGVANTKALCESAISHPAAQLAAAYTADGHTDFCLPARHEARIGHINAPDLFNDGTYWTSTQLAAHGAWCQFSDGSQGWNYKDANGRVRAVRRIPLVL